MPLPRHSIEMSLGVFCNTFDFRSFQISSTVWELDIGSAVSETGSLQALNSLSLNFHKQTLGKKPFLGYNS